MKKFRFILLLFLFIPFIVKGETVGISNTDINSITFGDDWAIVTRDNYKEVLANYGFSDTDITNTYSKWTVNSYYMDAFTKDFSKEIFLIYKKETSDVDNMSSLTDSDIMKETSELRSQYEVYNAKEAIYNANGVKYLKMSYLDSSLNIYVIDYITIVNNYLYQFKVQKNSSEFTDSEINEIDGIVSSTKYDVNTVDNNDENNSDDNMVISPNPNKDKGDSSLNSILIGTIVGAIVGAVIGITIKLSNNKKNKNNNL